MRWRSEFRKSGKTESRKDRDTWAAEIQGFYEYSVFRTFRLFPTFGLEIKFVSLQPGTKKNDLVAQPVEQLTLNQWVESSILSQVTTETTIPLHLGRFRCLKMKTD